jgi:4-hydroxybenzoate polyprenyltransferase
MWWRRAAPRWFNRLVDARLDALNRARRREPLRGVLSRREAVARPRCSVLSVSPSWRLAPVLAPVAAALAIVFWALAKATTWTHVSGLAMAVVPVGGWPGCGAS